LSGAQTDLAEKSKNLLLKAWQERRLIPENYNADTGEGWDVQSSDSCYHWGGLLGMLFLMEKGFIPGPETPLPLD
jgi:putative isomerase